MFLWDTQQQLLLISGQSHMTGNAGLLGAAREGDTLRKGGAPIVALSTSYTYVCASLLIPVEAETKPNGFGIGFYIPKVYD